ncbi:uracil/xanthine transporter [Bacillus sp. FJAT-49732]|uniref:Uracil/xanthine transporter n=1 Tax=Lederbergia citrisecunda TaxID=2833583 RepID=A0A942TL85_9BACI|nr:uracil/xanthine transporter [Lederbergia citrisecunda]MBS4198717.1 uracil/xanthine transporter [Lederbergia citrisecunda]
MSKLSSLTTMFASLQWLFFIFANIVVVPVSIGFAFDLSSADIASILRTSLIVTGIACMLQGLWGHRYPLMEGPSGVIWGMLLNLSLSAPVLGLSLTEVGGGIATGMLLAGAATLLIVVLKLIPFIKKVFSPMVLSVYLFLLTFQLVFVFFKGMLKVNEDGTLDLPITLFSFCIAILVALIKVKGSKMVGNFSILIGMIGGWILYSLLFPTEQQLSTGAVGLFNLFPLGKPNLELGIIAITFLGCLINLINTITSIQAASKLMNEKAEMSQYRNSYILTGLYTFAASLFGLVSYAPFASSIGFLESTQIYKKKPFIIGGALISLLGIVPYFSLLLATLPITVGNAVLFVAYLQLFGTSLKSLGGYSFNSITIHRIAAPVLIGVCLMTVGTELFSNFPAVIQPLISNGFIMGVLISIFLEAVVNWDTLGLEKISAE